MKIFKRLLLIFSIFFVVLIALAIILPIVYKKEILAKTKEEINKNVRAKVDFDGIDLSLFSHFPNFTFKLNDYSVVGIDDFEGVPLAKGESFAFTVDLWTLINRKGPFQIKSIYMEKPDINVLVRKDGRANYDITIPTDERIKEEAATTDYSSFAGELQKYAIHQANLVYDDRSMDFYMGIKDMNHSGKGNFTIDVFDLVTHTDMAELTVKYGGISYLKKAKVDYDAIFNIDQKNSKYTFKDNVLTLNALQLKTDGFVQLKGNDIGMDLDFSTPQSDFKDLWSM
ncbi:MAG TPA: AsmA family protein, partial [Saprospiraceae bacterium]|nr:AsmA family protein [Saprospiraceae bacterium]